MMLVQALTELPRKQYNEWLFLNCDLSKRLICLWICCFNSFFLWFDRWNWCFCFANTTLVSSVSCRFSWLEGELPGGCIMSKFEWMDTIPRSGSCSTRDSKPSLSWTCSYRCKDLTALTRKLDNASNVKCRPLAMTWHTKQEVYRKKVLPDVRDNPIGDPAGKI